MWFVNTPGLNRLGMGGHPSGHIFRRDKQLAVHTATDVLDLSDVSARLCRYGVTDATPDPGTDDLEYLDNAIETGMFRQRVHVLSAPGTGHYRHLTFGPVKRILDDDSLDLTHIEEWIAGVHASGRPVAVHCVTVVQLIVTITALRTVGALPGDRIEHAAMVPDDCLGPMTDLGVTVRSASFRNSGRVMDSVVMSNDLSSKWICLSTCFGVELVSGVKPSAG